MVGIYRIRNLINNSCYYGSSNNIEKRWKRHRNELNKHTHINCILQRAWDRNGENNFIFEIIEECSKELLFEIEQKYLNLNPEYNIAKQSSGGDNITNNPNKLQIIKNITKAIVSRYESMSEDEKKLKYSKPNELNPNWKGGLTFCECGNRISSKTKTCSKCRDRYGENNPFYGKTHSDECKKNASIRQTGIYNGKQNNPIIIDGVEYRSAGEASEKLGIPMVTIRWRVKSNNPKFNNYTYN